jgi:hypothetical protein
VKTLFFRPEYFLGADELAAEKVALVRERFAEAEVPLNTSLRPVSYFHSLVLWTRFSGSSLHAALQRGRRLQARQAAGALLGLGGVLLAAGGVRRGRSAGWTRGMLACVVMSSGFCGMALEMLLILVFQSLYGYVYTRIALIVAVFMLGLVLGAPSGSALSAGGGRWTWLVLAACEILLLLCAAAIVPAVNFAGGAGGLGARSEALILLLVAAAGWAVGAEFPVCNRLYCRAGGAVGAGAAITHASDHVGAAGARAGAGNGRGLAGGAQRLRSSARGLGGAGAAGAVRQVVPEQAGYRRRRVAPGLCTGPSAGAQPPPYRTPDVPWA